MRRTIDLLDRVSTSFGRYDYVSNQSGIKGWYSRFFMRVWWMIAHTKRYEYSQVIRKRTVHLWLLMIPKWKSAALLTFAINNLMSKGIAPYHSQSSPLYATFSTRNSIAIVATSASLIHWQLAFHSFLRPVISFSSDITTIVRIKITPSPNSWLLLTTEWS